MEQNREKLKQSEAERKKDTALKVTDCTFEIQLVDSNVYPLCSEKVKIEQDDPLFLPGPSCECTDKVNVKSEYPIETQETESRLEYEEFETKDSCHKIEVKVEIEIDDNTFEAEQVGFNIYPLCSEVKIEQDDSISLRGPSYECTDKDNVKLEYQTETPETESRLEYEEFQPQDYIEVKMEFEIEESKCEYAADDKDRVKCQELDIKEKKRIRNQEYQRAWRRRQKELKKKNAQEKNEEKEEKKRKRHRENQRAYYQRTKGLKENDKNVEELSQKKLDGLQMKRKKLDSNEDQENVVQCRASQNLENVQLELNQLLTQKLRICEVSHECITPEVILHRNKDIPSDSDCLFHSLIHILQLQILACDLRRQLLDSPYLNSCHNPQEANKILSSNNEYGDLDCLYLFAKMYNKNICVHYHNFNVISENEDTRFFHFKANDTDNWMHLDLRERHFTPYLSDEEKKKEDERKLKQKNREYSKRYRDKKRKSSLQTGLSSRHVLYVPPVICSSQIADLSSRDVPLIQPEYQRAWRQRKKDLKKKDSKEDKEEKKRKTHRGNQRAYYQHTKGLKENDKNVEELSQKKLDDLQKKIKKLNSIEDHFTPYFSDDEKRKEDERKQKQKNREYSKRYRDKKRISKLKTGPSNL